MPGKRAATVASSNPIPTKWVVGIIAALIAYTLLQPVLDKQFGWQLPSLASLQQVDAPTSSPKEDSATSPTESSLDRTHTDLREPSSTADASSAEISNPSLRYGVLRETATDDFLSPGGLRYTRGSEEGHRLKHIQRHLEDDPDRPGKHGVFHGDMAQVILWIDEAHALAKRGAKGSRMSEEDGRTVYEASFSKPIGYIGGRDGRRDNNPDARRLRLVVDGNKVITAFPF